MDDSRLTDQKYTELEYLFQTIEMAKSGQDFKNFRDDTAASLSALATTPPAAQLLELPQEDDLNDSNDAVNPYAWNLVKRRLRRHRRFTVSHGTPPPAPPSTPTSSSMTLASSSFSSSSGGGGGGGGNGGGGNVTDYDSDCFNFNLLYILDYAPKYKKKLKEQQRTDSELAELFNVVTITGNGGDKASSSQFSRALKCSTSSSQSSTASSSKLTPERGISSASRNIRKQDNGTKIFKIHRNPKEFFRDPDEEDSVSAPEYDTEEEDTRHRRFTRLKPSRRLMFNKRQRRYEKFKLQERMDAVVDTFDAAMSFADA